MKAEGRGHAGAQAQAHCPGSVPGLAATAPQAWGYHSVRSVRSVGSVRTVRRVGPV